MSEKTPPFTLTVEAPRFVGLIDCRLHTPINFRIENFASKPLRCTLCVSSAEGIVMPFERELLVTGEEEVLSVPDLFSPARLAEGGVRRVTLSATLQCGGETVCAEQVITALPAGYWEGLGGNAMRLAAFADPYCEECGRVLAIAREIEKRRGGALAGYGAGSDAERALFAVFSAMRVCARAEVEQFNAAAPVCALNEGCFGDRPVNALGAGLLACASLEAAGFNPVLAVGKRRAAVGVWRYDSHLLAPVEEAGEVAMYLGGAAENLVFLDAEDLFPARKISFARSKARFFEGMKAGEYSLFVDIRRCRAAGYTPPPPSPNGGESPHGGLPYRASKWESELVDASARNPLLNFSGKHALRLLATDADGLLSALGERRAMRLTPCNAAKGGRELEFAALARDEIAVSMGEKEMRTLLSKMLRDDREAEEETGAGLLHLAFGLLKYPHEGKAQSAPVALLPVTLVRDGGDFFLRAREGLFFNPAFGAHREGDEAAPATVKEAYAAVRAAVEGKEGYRLEEGVHLALFSFRGRVIWNDLKHNLPEFMKNKLVRSLLTGRAEEGLFACGAHVEPPRPLFFTDASQDEALALAETGASFVLHGPPGTGKSQTIANLIANAMRRGKRVLFVAEKQAALEVVWRRLEKAGLGDFCLQLPVRADRAEVARKILHTLSLTENEAPMSAMEPPVFAVEPPMSAMEETDALERELEEPVEALHARGRLGTPYEAILGALREGDAPALGGGTPAFYGALKEEDLAGYRHALVSAAVAAKACGALGGMPFGSVDLPAYSEEKREGALCASETLLAACAHLERMLSLFLSFYGQRMPVRTAARLNAAAGLAGRLLKGADAVYFEGVTAEEVRAFCEQNARLDARLTFYFRTFRALVKADGDALSRYVREGGEWKFHRALRTVARRLTRLAVVPIDEADMPKILQTLSDIYELSQTLSASPYARHIVGGDGRLSQTKRSEFREGLASLNALCAEAFPAFDCLAFYNACIRARGPAEPILRGLVSAVENFFTARRAFVRATGGDERPDDDVLTESASRAAALIDNADLFRAFCRCRETVRRLEGEGIGDISGLISRGAGEKMLVAAFEKEAYRRFLEEEILARPALTRFTAAETEARVSRLRSASERARENAISEARRTLISHLPREGAEYASERAALLHAARGNGGGGVRGLLAAAPRLVAAAAPCLIMSPASVAQYLPAEANLFDLAVFDEASQMTSAEAAGSVARAKAAIVAGDPNQLPPTRFFMGEEDGESVLDACLALGMPERKLRWHYRSRRERLIAFCNEAYYDGALFTVPSPDADMDRVKLVRVGGMYDRGGKKHNRAEAEALVGEIVRRLKDPGEKGRSMGVVTFSLAQREEIEKLLSRALEREGLEEAAYGGTEPLFVKNLENVQGDERDVILFSVCYGPDREGKVSMNFGPLNRAGGWRRLNVAASRAREEMLVFSSLSPAMIDAEKTSSRGVKDLKRFLELAERGGAPASRGEERGGIGYYIARELSKCGYFCRLNVGASKFKADVAVVDPRDKNRFLLAVFTDCDPTMSAKERYLVREEGLRRAGWAVTRVSSAEFYMNPKREAERLKSLADGLCGRRENARLARYAHRYRYAAEAEREDARFLLAEENAAAICGRLKEIVLREQPISREFLVRRLLAGYGVEGGKRLSDRVLSLIDRCAFPRDVAAGVEYYYFSPRAIGLDRYRTEGKRALRRSAQDYSAYEIVSMVRGALEDRVALYPDDLAPLFEETFRAARADGAGAQFLLKCVKYGEERGIFSRSPSERITLR